jgi:hypothetical protein
MDIIAKAPALLRAYEQYEKAASDFTTGVNGARRDGQNEVLDLVKQGYTAEQIEAKLSANRKGQITK